LYWELDVGNTDNSQLSTKLLDHQDLIRLELLDSSKSKDTPSTDAESEEEEEREQSTRELFLVNQSIKVLENKRKQDHTEILLKKKLVENVQTWEFSALTGLVKMPLTNSSKLFALIQVIMPLRKTPKSTGLFLKNTTKESLEVLLQLVKNTEVLDKRVTELIIEDHQYKLLGEEETPKNSEEDE